MKYRIPAYLLFIFFVSCENKAVSNDKQVAPAASIPLVPLATDSPANSNAGATVALNPKHGEPGHRCDIPEGSPLNAPVTSTNIQSTVNPATVTPAIIPSNAENKKEVPASNAGTTVLNPKHGEPGHRCDIAVGAPLNSKPAQ